jgi:Rv0078B-related antitoxin
VSDDLHPEQIRAIRAMSLDRRLAVGMALLKSARRMRRAALRQQHPEWTDEQLEDALRRWTRDAGA